MNSNRINTLDNYLKKFNNADELDIKSLWQEMDRVWEEHGLNNRTNLSKQNIEAFYSHPVWILNGIFSEKDPISKSHRVAIAKYLNHLPTKISVADLGGGSGVLAQTIMQNTQQLSKLHIIEPWAFDYFKSKFSTNPKIEYLDDFSKEGYDVVIAQDVLEHVEDPINAVIRCLNATHVGGYLIFANNFSPVIKCHLPTTFYLRHTFSFVLASKGVQFIERIPGAEHALVFKKLAETNPKHLDTRNRIAKNIGPLLNFIGQIKALTKL
ncbi:MAG: methyltransferase domain-containing protein [Oligoflexales bacterium]|nr:methyltransferase domain-containing protein [Oligoflexales bacterium]